MSTNDHAVANGVEATGEPGGNGMDIRVVVRTLYQQVLATRAVAIVGADQGGTFIVDRSSAPLIAAVEPCQLRLHHGDGEVTVLDVSWGTITAVGGDVRIVVRDASIHGVPRVAYDEAV